MRYLNFNLWSNLESEKTRSFPLFFNWFASQPFETSLHFLMGERETSYSKVRPEWKLIARIPPPGGVLAMPPPAFSPRMVLAPVEAANTVTRREESS
jgi:hypothetical protein